MDNVAAERRRRAAAGEEAGPAGTRTAVERGPAFPVPPLDLPHYHGVGVAVPGEEPEASPAGPVKEVTGA